MGCYSLSDPRTGKVRYVGRARDLKVRFYSHLNNPHSSVKPWIRELKTLKLRPILKPLDNKLTEAAWIDKLMPDLNRRRGIGDPTPFGRYLKKQKISTTDAASELDVTKSYVNALAGGYMTPGLKLALEIVRWSKGAVAVDSWVK